MTEKKFREAMLFMIGEIKDCRGFCFVTKKAYLCGLITPNQFFVIRKLLRRLFRDCPSNPYGYLDWWMGERTKENKNRREVALMLFTEYVISEGLLEELK